MAFGAPATWNWHVVLSCTTRARLDLRSTYRSCIVFQIVIGDWVSAQTVRAWTTRTHITPVMVSPRYPNTKDWCLHIHKRSEETQTGCTYPRISACVLIRRNDNDTNDIVSTAIWAATRLLPLTTSPSPKWRIQWYVQNALCRHMFDQPNSRYKPGCN
jgi:hypothetical protein